jgi:hypothetical protein
MLLRVAQVKGGREYIDSAGEIAEFPEMIINNCVGEIDIHNALSR